MGLRCTPEEKLGVAVELEGGLTDELENRHATLLLTNKRLIRYSASGHKTNVVSTALSDIDSFEVSRTERNRQWLLVGAVFIAGGLLLALVPLLGLPSPHPPLSVLPAPADGWCPPGRQRVRAGGARQYRPQFADP